MDEFRINCLISGTGFTVDRKLAAENYREWWRAIKRSEILSIIGSCFNVVIGQPIIANINTVITVKKTVVYLLFTLNNWIVKGVK